MVLDVCQDRTSTFSDRNGRELRSRRKGTREWREVGMMET